MTRRSITTILGSLLVGLVLIANAPSVGAEEIGGGDASRIIVSAGGVCDSFDAQSFGPCAGPVASGVSFSVASAQPPTMISTVDYHYIEINTTTLPSVGSAIAASTVVSREQQRFIEENTILPGAWTAIYMETVTSLPGQDR